jgi:hypothetical protein
MNKCLPQSLDKGANHQRQATEAALKPHVRSEHFSVLINQLKNIRKKQKTQMPAS